MGWVEGLGVSFQVKLPLHTHTDTHTRRVTQASQHHNSIITGWVRNDSGAFPVSKLSLSVILTVSLDLTEWDWFLMVFSNCQSFFHFFSFVFGWISAACTQSDSHLCNKTVCQLKRPIALLHESNIHLSFQPPFQSKSRHYLNYSKQPHGHY